MWELAVWGNVEVLVESGSTRIGSGSDTIGSGPISKDGGGGGSGSGKGSPYRFKGISWVKERGMRENGP